MDGCNLSVCHMLPQFVQSIWRHKADVEEFFFQTKCSTEMRLIKVESGRLGFEFLIMQVEIGVEGNCVEQMVCIRCSIVSVRIKVEFRGIVLLVD